MEQLKRKRDCYMIRKCFFKLSCCLVVYCVLVNVYVLVYRNNLILYCLTRISCDYFLSASEKNKSIDPIPRCTEQQDNMQFPAGQAASSTTEWINV